MTPKPRHRKLEGSEAQRLWATVCRRRCWTDRGSGWTWAEIDSAVCNVHFHANSGDLLARRPDVEVYIDIK